LKTSPPRIAFFGGTFDPIHEGHLEVAEKAKTALQLDQVLFLPCRQSPHKKKQPQASDQQRLEMIEIATSGLPWAEVSDYDLANPPPSYTWKTIKHFQSDLPSNAQLFLILGLDQWKSLPQWKHPERIAQMAEFIVIGRDGNPESRSGYTAHFLPGNHPASATQIRNSLAHTQDASWLPQLVFNYIRDHQLYQKH